MKASVSYNDFEGTAAADLADHISEHNGSRLLGISSFLKINEERFKVVGISVYGTDNLSLSLLCVDNEKSTPDKEHLVSMSIPVKNKTNVFDLIFKRLNVVLYLGDHSPYKDQEIDEEVRYSDYHTE